MLTGKTAVLPIPVFVRQRLGPSEKVFLRVAGGTDIGQGLAQHRRTRPCVRADQIATLGHSQPIYSSAPHVMSPITRRHAKDYRGGLTTRLRLAVAVSAGAVSRSPAR